MNKYKASSPFVLAMLGNRNAFSFYIMVSLWVLCTLLYYFGELLDLTGWEVLKWGFFYGVHDVHRLFFLAPITYAGYVFGFRAAFIVTVIAIMTFLPRALFISTFPDPLLRVIILTLVAGTMSYLAARVRSDSERRNRLEVLLSSERDKCFGILERMGDGVIITGPDYRIRFLNQSMLRNFGDGVGSHCYQYLYNLESPCERGCKLPQVIGGKTERWEYSFQNSTTYEVLASPHVDADGVVCQLATFRNITHRKRARSKPAVSTD